MQLDVKQSVNLSNLTIIQWISTGLKLIPVLNLLHLESVLNLRLLHFFGGAITKRI